MKVLGLNGQKLFAMLGIIMLLVVSAGCSEAEKFSWEKLKDTHYRMVTGKNLQRAAQPAANSGGQAKISVPPDKQETAKNKGQSKVNVVLYFANQEGEYLAPEKREMVLVPGLARATVEELINGPKEKGLLTTIPKGTRLLDINIDQGLCRVNLSREFRDNHWGGSSGEILTVYSLVNTLTQFPAVEKVEILIEGKKIDTLAGHMDLSVPVYRNYLIIKNKK